MTSNEQKEKPSPLLRVSEMFCDHEVSVGEPVRVLLLNKKTFDELRLIKTIWGDTHVDPPRPKDKGIVGYLWGAAVRITKGKERTE
jgi:hypothetical protein